MSSPASTAREVETLDNFIGGRWVKARTSEFFDVHNPAVGEVIGRTPLSTAADVDAAVQAATNAFPAWRDTPVNSRAQVLYKVKQLMEQHFDEMARIVDIQLNRVNERLAERGLVERRADPADGRGVRLSLTAAGRTTQRAIGRRHARSVTQAMTAGLTRAEMAQLEMICRKLACASDTREVVFT